jgi:hypothetical protein
MIKPSPVNAIAAMQSRHTEHLHRRLVACQPRCRASPLPRINYLIKHTFNFVSENILMVQYSFCTYILIYYVPLIFFLREGSVSVIRGKFWRLVRVQYDIQERTCEVFVVMITSKHVVWLWKTLEISRPISRQRSAAVSRALFPFWPLSPGVGSFSFTCREGEPIHVLIRWYGWSVAHVVVPM